MSILSKFVHAVWSRLYPKVEEVVNKVEEVKEVVHDAVEEVGEILISPAKPPGQMIAEILDAYAAMHKMDTGEDLTHWRSSIVDTLKLAGEDSSYAARKQLAAEFGKRNYKGTAEDNVWLQAQFLTYLE